MLEISFIHGRPQRKPHQDLAISQADPKVDLRQVCRPVRYPIIIPLLMRIKETHSPTIHDNQDAFVRPHLPAVGEWNICTCLGVTVRLPIVKGGADRWDSWVPESESSWDWWHESITKITAAKGDDIPLCITRSVPSFTWHSEDENPAFPVWSNLSRMT